LFYRMISSKKFCNFPGTVSRTALAQHRSLA